jgi:hypothetical protein
VDNKVNVNNESETREKKLNSRERELDSREKELDLREDELDIREDELDIREKLLEQRERNFSAVSDNVVLDLIIIRCRKDGSRAMAKPCVRCLPCIRSAGVRYIYYTDWEGNLIRELASEMITTHVCSKNLCENEPV